MMSVYLRKLRGVAGISLIWAPVWAAMFTVLTCILQVFLPLDSDVGSIRMMLLIGWVGLISGGIFGTLFRAGVPVELHIYAHGGHAGGIKPRDGIPFGTWHYRFQEWLADLGVLKPATGMGASFKGPVGLQRSSLWPGGSSNRVALHVFSLERLQTGG